MLLIGIGIDPEKLSVMHLINDLLVNIGVVLLVDHF
jgi:hypothetical protein